MKFILFAIFSLILCSCSNDKPSYNSVNGGYTRSNNYESFDKVFSNYINFKEFKFDNIIDSSGFLFPPFMLNSYEFLYISKANIVHIVSEDRVMSSINLRDDIIVSNPCKDNNDNIYFQVQNGTIFSYNIKDRRSPKLNWKTEKDTTNSGLYSDLVIFNNKIYSSSTSNGLKVYNNKGQLENYISFNNGLRDFSISENGIIYFASTQDDFNIEDTLFAIKDGSIKYSKSLLGRLYSAPICVNNDIIIPILFQINGENFVRIVRLDSTGKEVSRIETNKICKFISADSKGNIYTVSDNPGIGADVSYLNKYSKEGKKLWELVVDLSINSPLLVCEDALVFCGERDSATGLFYIDKNNGKLLSSISLSSIPAHNLVPVFKSSGGIIFGASKKAGIIVIERSMIDKILN